MFNFSTSLNVNPSKAKPFLFFRGKSLHRLGFNTGLGCLRRNKSFFYYDGVFEKCVRLLVVYSVCAQVYQR